MQSNPLILLLLNLNQWNKTEGQPWDQQGEMLHRIPGASVLFTKWTCQDAICSFYSAAAALIVSYNTKGEKRPNRMKLSFSITLQPSSTFHFSRKPNHLHTHLRTHMPGMLSQTSHVRMAHMHAHCLQRGKFLSRAAEEDLISIRLFFPAGQMQDREFSRDAVPVKGK